MLDFVGFGDFLDGWEKFIKVCGMQGMIWLVYLGFTKFDGIYGF